MQTEGLRDSRETQKFDTMRREMRKGQRTLDGKAISPKAHRTDRLFGRS